LVSPSRQCFSTPVGFRQEFFSKKDARILELPPYSTDLAAPDFYLFPRLKGWRFSGATEIIKDAKEGLKNLPQNGFQEYSQQFCSSWQKCIFVQGLV
jgi:hypothetical protein